MDRKRMMPHTLALLLPLCLLCLFTGCAGPPRNGAAASSDRVGEILYEHVMEQNEALAAENKELRVQISRLEVRERELRATTLAYAAAPAGHVLAGEAAELLWMPSRHAMPTGSVGTGASLAVDLEGTDEEGVTWLFVHQEAAGPEDAPLLAGWIRKDRTEPDAGE